jgi:hypothetical protein
MMKQFIFERILKNKKRVKVFAISLLSLFAFAMYGHFFPQIYHFSCVGSRTLNFKEDKATNTFEKNYSLSFTIYRHWFGLANTIDGATLSECLTESDSITCSGDLRDINGKVLGSFYKFVDTTSLAFISDYTDTVNGHETNDFSTDCQRKKLAFEN